MTGLDLHLASKSPRRREILAALGLRFTFGGAGIDESVKPGEAFPDLVVRLAAAKADAVFDAGDYAVPVLGADTVVVVDDQVFGKPQSKEHALSMLTALSGRTHRVLTGVAVRTCERSATSFSETSVRFREIDPDEAAAYWQSGEPDGKAGAYAVQGVGGVFVESIEGSYSGVVGLPVYETAVLLKDAGLVLPRRSGPGQWKEDD